MVRADSAAVAAAAQELADEITIVMNAASELIEALEADDFAIPALRMILAASRRQADTVQAMRVWAQMNHARPSAKGFWTAVDEALSAAVRG